MLKQNTAQISASGHYNDIGIGWCEIMIDNTILARFGCSNIPEIVKRLNNPVIDNDSKRCEWRENHFTNLSTGITDIFYDVCNYSRYYASGQEVGLFISFKYCPYCGKRIKIIKDASISSR